MFKGIKNKIEGYQENINRKIAEEEKIEKPNEITNSVYNFINKEKGLKKYKKHFTKGIIATIILANSFLNLNPTPNQANQNQAEKDITSNYETQIEEITPNSKINITRELASRGGNRNLDVDSLIKEIEEKEKRIEEEREKEKREEQRQKKIDHLNNYLENRTWYNSNGQAEPTPLEGLGEHIVKVAEKYGIEPELILAIARQESTMGLNGPLATRDNNPFGLQNFSFETIEEAIDKFGDILYRLYLNDPILNLKGLSTEEIIKGMARKYAGEFYYLEWQDNAIIFYNEIKKYEPK